MEKIEVGVKAIGYPMPCAIVGTMVSGKANFLTVAFFSMVHMDPPYIMASLSKSHHTNAGIKESGAFSVNIPSASLAEATDYCGLVSGADTDKSAVFDVFRGKHTGTPMAGECPYNLECRLVQTVELPQDEIFIGEIVGAYSDERYLTDGAPDLEKIDPFILSTMQTYVGLGATIGHAWSIGKGRITKG